MAPRDPDATFVSFFICGKTEECTMLAFHVSSSQAGREVGRAADLPPAEELG